jgi:hypothetical protein
MKQLTEAAIAKRKNVNKKLLKVFGVIFAFIFIISYACGAFDATKTPESNMPDKEDAFIMAQGFVRAQLKSPSTADFSNNYKCVPNSDSSYAIDLQVDSQNSFGAMLRSNWRVILKWKGGNIEDNSNWDVEYLDME